MKNKKDSDLYKKGIRYKPNVDTIVINAEEASGLLGIDYHQGFFHEDNPLRRLPPGVSDDVLNPIEKKLEW